MKGINLAKLARVLGMLGSASPGERNNAAMMADRLVRAAGMQWIDFLTAAAQLAVATAAAESLLAENTALHAEVERLRLNGGMVAPWQEVGAAISNVPTAAQWALGLYAQGRVWLSP